MYEESEESDEYGVCYKLVATTCYDSVRTAELVRSTEPYSTYIFAFKENAEKFCGLFLNKGIEVVEDTSYFTDFILKNCIDLSVKK